MRHQKFEITDKRKSLEEILEDFDAWMLSESGWWYLLYQEDNTGDEGRAIVDKFVKDLSEIFPDKSFKRTPIREIEDGQYATFDLIYADKSGGEPSIRTFETGD